MKAIYIKQKKYVKIFFKQTPLSKSRLFFFNLKSHCSMSKGTRLVVREPLRQSKADLNRAKDTFERIHEIVLMYTTPLLIDMSFANLLWKRYIRPPCLW